MTPLTSLGSGVVATPNCAPNTRIILVMICGNEEQTIGRCLEAALPFVDAAVLCCNGSDGTALEAQFAANRRCVVLEVVRQEWRNFGHNRTLSARAAEGFARELGWDLEHTWFLFLDADMVLRGELDRSELTADKYMIVQRDGTTAYENIRLVRASKSWTCHGATHEYWQAEEPTIEGRLPKLWIDDRGDGGSKADKFERDIRLLTAELERDPSNTRARFYLAESCFYAGRFAEALGHYRTRAEAGGWEPERWFAQYRAGCALLRLGNTEPGAGELLKAFGERPHRAEPLYELGRHYRELGRNDEAAMVIERAFRMVAPSPEGELFVDVAAYEVGVPEELTCVWYYTGKREQARQLCEHLLRALGVAERSAHIAAQLSWYVQPLPRVDEGYLAHPFAHSLERETGCRWYDANPSIARVHRELLRTVRLVNYTQERGRSYVSGSPDRKIRTRNVLTLESGADYLIDDSIVERLRWPDAGEVLGLEDMRLFELAGECWFTATCCQVPGADGAPRVVLGRIDPSGILLGQDPRIDHLVALDYAEQTRCEKNWLPWVLGDELNLVYSWHPFVVLRVDPATGKCARRTDTALTMGVAHRWRGSARPVFVDGRWIAIVHEVARRSDRNVYLHRFVELTDAGASGGPEVLGYSQAFRLGEAGIEYVAGAELVGNDLEVTFGVEDREARWLRISVDQLNRVLPPAPPVALPVAAAAE